MTSFRGFFMRYKEVANFMVLTFNLCLNLTFLIRTRYCGRFQFYGGVMDIVVLQLVLDVMYRFHFFIKAHGRAQH